MSWHRLNACKYRRRLLKRKIFPHLMIQGRQRFYRTGGFRDRICRFKILITTGAPKPTLRVDDQRMPYAAAEDVGIVCTDVRGTSPGKIRSNAINELFHFIYQSAKQRSPRVGRRLQGLGDGIAQDFVAGLQGRDGRRSGRF